MSDRLIQPGFLFSQHSLGTYVRCPRRFLLKYIDRQPWPMPEDDDPQEYQQQLARGRIFHQWLARAQLGLDVAPAVDESSDARLQAWWQAASTVDWGELPPDIREVELSVVVPLGDFRLYARYDLLALTPGEEAVIVDWKTLERRPSQRIMAERMQTRAYLYSLVVAGHVLSGGAPVHPAQASMRYWFANFPQEPAEIPYSRPAFERDRVYLHRLIEEITRQPREDFVRAKDARACVRCNYRSLCERTEMEASGDKHDWLDEDLAFELEELPELDY
jgi:RecB family exonuclease